MAKLKDKESSNLKKPEYTKMYWVSKKRLEKIFNSKKKLPAGLIAATFYYLYKLN